MAEPNSTSRDRTRAAQSRPNATPPITRHPLFPAIVALWFAALLGMGSFALSTTLLERFVLATNLDRLIHAATPPLGVTARLLVALAFGGFGAIIGWALARRVATSAAKPAPQVFKVADVDIDLPQVVTPARPAPVLDPASLAEPLADLPVQTPEPVAEAPRALTAAERIAEADLAELSHVELIERLAIALQRREARLGAASEEPADESASLVVPFADFADRRHVRAAAPATARLAPQETEAALRNALAQLQRMSGSAA